MDIASIINPFSNKYHACHDLTEYAKGPKTVAVALGIFALSACVGVLTFGVGGVALFRTLAAYVTDPRSAKVHKVAANILTSSQEKDLKAVFKKTNDLYPHQTQRLDTLFQYLTDDTFVYKETYYDMGYEDNFGLRWIQASDPFLEKMRQKYPAEVALLQSASTDEVMDESRIGARGQDIRLANNNIFNLLVVAEKNPEIHKLLRETMIYSLLKQK